jgi:hypothetical protein
MPKERQVEKDEEEKAGRQSFADNDRENQWKVRRALVLVTSVFTKQHQCSQRRKYFFIHHRTTHRSLK